MTSIHKLINEIKLAKVNNDLVTVIFNREFFLELRTPQGIRTRKGNIRYFAGVPYTTDKHQTEDYRIVIR